jgi:putative addiction module component (TIGR02574 family)
MSIAEIVEELPKLTVDDRDELRLRLLELEREIWTDSSHPLTDSEKALLDARLAAYRKAPDAGSSWEDVEERLLSKIVA